MTANAATRFEELLERERFFSDVSDLPVIDEDRRAWPSGESARAVLAATRRVYADPVAALKARGPDKDKPPKTKTSLDDLKNKLFAAVGLEVVEGAEFDEPVALEGVELKHPVFFVDCAFRGGLSLRGAQTRSIYFDDCVFSCAPERSVTVDVENADIEGVLWFRRSKIYDTLNASNVRISKNFDLRGAVIEPRSTGYAILGNMAQVGGHVRLDGFHRTVTDNSETRPFQWYAKNREPKEAKPEGFVCAGRINLYSAEIGGILSFATANLRRPARRTEAESESDPLVTLENASVGRMVFVSHGATIDGSLRMLNLRCDYVYLNETAINGDVVANHLRVDRSLTIGRCAIRGQLVLNDARVGDYADDHDYWPAKGKLHVIGFEYGSLGSSRGGRQFEHAGRRIEWLNRQPAPVLGLFFEQQPWDQLQTVFQNLGYHDEASKVFMRRETQRCQSIFIESAVDLVNQFWRQATGKNRTLGDRVAALGLLVSAAFSFVRGLLTLVSHVIYGLIWGYGRRPGRAVIASLAVVFGGFCAFAVADASGHMRPAKEDVVALAIRLKHLEEGTVSAPTDGENAETRCYVPYEPFNPFVYSLDVFVPFLDLEQADYWVPKETGEVVVDGRDHLCLPPDAMTSGIADALRAYVDRKAAWLRNDEFSEIFRIIAWIHSVIGWIVVAVTGYSFGRILQR